jgi:tetratricopeptide (TPR) repeat protein
MFPWRYPEYRGQQTLPECAGNQYLTIFAEYGAAGAALALWTIVAFAVAVILILRARARRYSASTPSNRYAFAVSGLAAFTAAVVDTALDCSFGSFVNQLALATIMGAALTCGIQNHTEGPPKSHSAGRLTLLRMTKVHRVLLTSCSLLGVGLFLWLLVHTCPSSILLYQAGRYVAQEQWSAARDLYRKTLRLDPKNFAAITGMGDVMAAGKETDELGQALTWYERALVLNPYAHGLRIKMGQIHDRLDNREKADECYRLAVHADPRNAAYHVAYAEHHLRWDEADLAKEAYRRAAALHPSVALVMTNAPSDVVTPPEE